MGVLKKYRVMPVVIILLPLAFGFISQVKQTLTLPDDSNTWFSASGKCILCHDTHPIALRDGSGNDVSPVSQWRSTMLANASKDPFWLAKVKHEGLENPSHKEDLENVCTRCHAPMGMINAFLNASGNYTLHHLAEDNIGKDGISCTVCHQIDDFSDQRFSGNFGINTRKEIYGPFENPVVNQMFVNTGYTPVYNDQINNSRLCGSCHTLFTNSVYENGEYTGRVFTEQALYHEWENSIYPELNTGCQTCHMPRIDEVIKITSRPLFLEGRRPFGQHVLTGGNLYMLTLLKDNHDELEIHSGEEYLQMAIDRTRTMLTSATIDLSIEEIVMYQDSVYIHVSMQNKAGHKFPTGFPSRRAYLECVVTNHSDTIFHSGKIGSRALVNFDEDSFEPHHEVITKEEQIQIYEFVMGDSNGKVTTVLERADIPLKDNRMVPRGFIESHRNYDTVQVVGRASMDADYFTAKGIEKITYAIPLAKIQSNATIKVTLHYETVPESWLHQLFTYASQDENINRFMEIYGKSDNTPVEIASDTKMIITTSTVDTGKHFISVYPNPSNGHIRVNNVLEYTMYSVLATDGRYIRRGYLNPGSNQVFLDLPQGSYLFVIHTSPQWSAKQLIITK